MIARVNGTELYYEVTGEGKPLVMVHGNGEDHTIFTEAAEALKDTFRCVLPDTRGHGQSPYSGELHYKDMADDAVALMESLDLRDVTFYGFSDGGITGLLAAMRCDRIKTLIVSGANLTPKGVKPWLGLLLRFLYLFKKDPKLKLMLTEPRIAKEDLARIRARTLVLAGSKDVIRERETRAIAEGIPGSTLLILEGEGHGSYIVHSEKIAGIIREFAGAEAAEA